MNFPLHNTRLIVEKYFSLPDLFVALLCEIPFIYIINRNAMPDRYGICFVRGYSSYKRGASD